MNPPSSLSAQEEAYQYILNGIRMGRFEPGQRLIAEEIAEELDMSRMPVREALRRLSGEGLIILRTNRGAVVKQLTKAEVQEIFEMRAVLEGLAASMAARNATAADIEELHLLLTQLRTVEHDLSKWITAHRSFHEKISSLSHAPRLLQQISALHTLVEPLMRVWLQSAPESKNVHVVHEKIVQLLQEGQAEALETLVKKHSRVTSEVILKALSRSCHQLSHMTAVAK